MTKKKFVLCMILGILIIVGIVVGIQMWATDGGKIQADNNTPKIAEDEDLDKSIPVGLETNGKIKWILPHYNFSGKLFQLDNLPEDYTPIDDRYKLFKFPVSTPQPQSTVEPVVDEPVSEVIVEPDEPVVETFATQDRDIGSDWTLTFYCPCARCNGVAGQPTASGRMPEVGVTVAVDPSIIKLGSRLKIDIPDGNGGYTCLMGYARADDTGGAIKGHKLDVFVGGHQEAQNKGVIHNARVTLLEVQ